MEPKSDVIKKLEVKLLGNLMRATVSDQYWLLTPFVFAKDHKSLSIYDSGPGRHRLNLHNLAMADAWNYNHHNLFQTDGLT